MAELSVEATTFSVGDKLLITGPTTGAIYVTADEIHDNDGNPWRPPQQGSASSIPVPGKGAAQRQALQTESLKERRVKRPLLPPR